MNEHINPDGLFKMDSFSQVVTTEAQKTIYIAGQGAFDKDFNLQGDSDYYHQTLQALQNLETALAAAGARPADVVSSTFYVVNLSNDALAGFSKALSESGFPPNASTMVGVAALAMPGMLVEISATAAVPL